MKEKQTERMIGLRVVNILSVIALIAAIIFAIITLFQQTGIVLGKIVGGMWGSLTKEELHEIEKELTLSGLYWQIPCAVVILTVSVVSLGITIYKRRAMRRAQTENPFSDDRFIRIRMIYREGRFIGCCIASVIICACMLCLLMMLLV